MSGGVERGVEKQRVWPMVRLGDVCEINLGKTPPRGDGRCWDKEKSSNHVWVSIADLNHAEEGQVFESKEYITEYAVSTAGVPVVKKGTLLLSFKLTLGRTAIAGRDLYTNEAIAALPFKAGFASKIDLKYLIAYFSFFDWMRYAEKDEKVLGKTLNKKKLALVPVLLPPLDVQREIVERLEKELGEIEKLKAAAERGLRAAENLRKAILSEAFE